MKKHRTTRLLSVILAVAMIFGSISVGVTAAYAPYLNDALVKEINFYPYKHLLLHNATEIFIFNGI